MKKYQNLVVGISLKFFGGRFLQSKSASDPLLYRLTTSNQKPQSPLFGIAATAFLVLALGWFAMEYINYVNRIYDLRQAIFRQDENDQGINPAGEAVTYDVTATRTATNTPTPTATPDLTLLRVNATAHTPTLLPTTTPTTTATETPTLPPTSTSTAIPTSTATPAATPTATSTPTSTAPPTSTATETPLPPTPTPTNTPQAGEAALFNGIHFVYVPSGDFIMGNSVEQIAYASKLCQTYLEQSSDSECQRFSLAAEHEQARQMSLPEFWIMQHEVTNGQYQKFIEAGGYAKDDLWSEVGRLWRDENNVTGPACEFSDLSDFDDPDKPIVCISWYEATAYARWLSVNTGRAYRLPTEAEWEKAARGENGPIFPWGDEWNPSHVNYCDTNCALEWADATGNDGHPLTASIGQFEGGRSPYNVYEMAGNVGEWTHTMDRPGPYALDDRESPEGAAARVVRGGSWFDAPTDVRTTHRSGNLPHWRWSGVGMRLVMEVGE